MIEIRKTEKYAHWLDGLRDINARRAFKSGSSVWRLGMAEMSSQLAKVSQSCESIMAQVTGFISHSAGASW
jgi:hypothetical protein